jgi:hypothetical protein
MDCKLSHSFTFLLLNLEPETLNQKPETRNQEPFFSPIRYPIFSLPVNRELFLIIFNFEF